MFRKAVLLGALSFIIASCTNEPTAPSVDDREISREVNWALVELNNLSAAHTFYKQDYGEDPDTIASLWRLGYLDIWVGLPEDCTYVEMMPSYDWWKFDFVRQGDSVSGFVAVSLKPMVDGAGHIITYDLADGSFSGYGMEHVDGLIFTHLIGRFMYPLLVFDLDTPLDGAETRRRFEVIREVNWAAEFFRPLRNAVLMFIQDYGEAPPDFSTLVEQEYIEPPSAVVEWWDFGFEAWESHGDWEVYRVYAISTEAMAGGAGDSLIYNFSHWTGPYGGAWARWKSPFVGP